MGWLRGQIAYTLFFIRISFIRISRLSFADVYSKPTEIFVSGSNKVWLMKVHISVLNTSFGVRFGGKFPEIGLEFKNIHAQKNVRHSDKKNSMYSPTRTCWRWEWVKL